MVIKNKTIVKAILLIGLFTPMLSSLIADDRQKSRPNIVIIMTDDLGYGDVSYLNPNSKIKTAQLDKLASESVWATDAHSPSAVCSPSRYAMLMGHYAWRLRKLRSGRLDPWEESVIKGDALSLPRMLDKNGYNTACIGKWHLGFDYPWKGGEMPSSDIIGKGTSKATCDMFDWSKPITGGPLGAGFDYYFGDDVPNMPPYAFIENDRFTCDPVDVNGKALQSQSLMKGGYIHGVGPGEEGWRLDKVMRTITSKAVSYIHENSHKKEPFFLYYSTTSPHSPIVPTKGFHGKSSAGFYGDFVIQTDVAVGQIVDALKQAEVFENTILIVTSDNGPTPFMRELIRSHEHDTSGGLRGLKRDILEGGHRVPFICSWPKGKLMGGRRVDATISLVDVFATCAGIIGNPLKPEEAVDSIDVFASLLENKSVRTELVYHASDGTLGLRQGTWSYLRKGGITKEPDWYLKMRGAEPVRDAPGLLFNLSVDLAQKTNLYEKYPEKVQSMEARLKSIQGSNRPR